MWALSVLNIASHLNTDVFLPQWQVGTENEISIYYTVSDILMVNTNREGIQQYDTIREKEKLDWL